MGVYLCRILTVLVTSYYSLFLYTSCVLLDPMTDKGRPTMKLLIKAIHIENYCCFFVYNSGDRIN